MYKIISIRFIVFLFSISILILFGCATLENKTGVKILADDLAKMKLEKGISHEKISMSNSRELLFTLSVPEIKDGKKVPFVIALHWAGAAKPYFADDYLRGLVEPGLKDINPIIFAPDVPGMNWTDPISVEAVLQFLEAAKTAWPIDTDKIILTGYSMGGNGVWYLIDKYSHKFNSAIPMASSPNGTLKGKVPTFIIHGKRDELFDWHNAQLAYDYLKNKGANVQIELSEQLSHYQGFLYVPILKNAGNWLKNDIWD